MARGTLHASKPEGQRRRRNKPTHDTTTLQDDGKVRGPELSELTGREDWPEAVRVWYSTWRSAPQAQQFEQTDWLRLAMLAPIVEAHFRRPSAAALGEIRMNEERLGATVVDRMRARLQIERDDSADDKPDAPVLRIADARDDVARRMRG